MASAARCGLMKSVFKRISSQSAGYLSRNRNPGCRIPTAPVIKTSGLLCAQAVIVAQAQESPKLKVILERLTQSQEHLPWDCVGMLGQFKVTVNPFLFDNLGIFQY